MFCEYGSCGKKLELQLREILLCNTKNLTAEKRGYHFWGNFNNVSTIHMGRHLCNEANSSDKLGEFRASFEVIN